MWFSGKTLNCRSRGSGFEFHMRRNLFLSCARSPCLLSPFGKMNTGIRLPGSPQSWDLKNTYLYPSLIDCAQLLYLRSGWKTYLTSKHIQFTHGHRICPPLTSHSLIIWTMNKPRISRLREVGKNVLMPCSADVTNLRWVRCDTK